MQHRVRIVAVSLFLLASVVACKKSDKADKAADPAVPAAPAPGSSAEPPATPPDKAAADPSPPTDTQYAKPGLTEDNIQRYLKSLPDFGKADATEYEALAKKHGFDSAADYLDTGGRVSLGELMLQNEEQYATMRAPLLTSIADTEKQAADPNMPAETKTAMTELITQTKKQLAEMEVEMKKAGGLNAADLALVKKLKPELAAAAKASMDAMRNKK
jgi:hypothetical protein